MADDGGRGSERPAGDIGLCEDAVTWPRWVRHRPRGWIFGWTRYPGWFLLHLGPGFLEWNK